MQPNQIKSQFQKHENREISILTMKKKQKANTSSGSHRKNQTKEDKKQKKNKIQNIRLGKIGDHICTNRRIKRYQENTKWRIWNTGADDFDSRDTAKETNVEILKIVNEAVDDTTSTTGSSSVKQLHETTDLWSLNP